MPNIMRNITDITRLGIQYRSEAFAPMGLKAFHGSYLVNICANPGVSQEQLAKNICINKSNVARQAAALEEDGFIRREPCEQDKRVMRLYPTEKTLALMPQLKEVMRTWRTLLLQDLSEEEQELMEKLLQKIKARADEVVEGMQT